MSFPDFIDISSDEENEATEAKDVKPTLQSHCIQILNYEVAQSRPDLEEYYVKQSIQAEISHNIANGVTCDSYQAELGSNQTDGLCPASSSHDSPVALCRQFWKSGEYETGRTPAPVHHSGKNRLRIHPKFLHSNATSHKWAFGAIAELLDNAVDEVQNRATFVIVDKFINPRNGEAALLIQDDGGGMDPESLRRCMSFGFSDKQSDATIGQYGNGFKTSTMRLGADVIVFSRCSNNRVLRQSVGLLSYTFLRQTGCDDIVVPVVDYVFDQITGAFARLLRSDEKQFSTNLSTFLRWSPFSSESELLEQPFWRVANNSYGKGRGVVGVLEANFVKPTHDKQDFEKSSIYQKLENRLKEMTYEYWDLHCYLIGYKPKVALPNMSSTAAPVYQMLPRLGTSVGIRQARVNHGLSVAGTTQPQVVMDLRIPTDTSHTTRQLTIYNSLEQTGLSQKRKQESHISTRKSIKKQAFVIRSAAGLGGNHKAQLEESAEQKGRHKMKTMMLENKKLREQCLEFEGSGRELLLKEEKLGIELRSFQQLYEKLTAELNSLDEVKVEKL